MRYAILLVLSVIALAFSGCEKSIDFDKEKASIIAVMDKETRSYIDRDFEAMFLTHVHDSMNMRLSAELTIM